MTGRILILEYDALLCDLIDLTLRRNGFETILCEDFSRIRDVIKTKHPDVIVIDTHLPDQNGIDLLRQLSAEKILEHISVIILSALGFPCIVKEAVEAGAEDFLVKPLDMDSLVSKLRSRWKDSENKASPPQRIASGQAADIFG